jgi:hypothetical protein
MNIIFNEELHKYYFEETSKPFTSVSKVLELIKDKFDSESESLKYWNKHKEAVKKPKKWDNTWTSVEDVRNAWESNRIKKTSRGTKYHNLRELESNNEGAFSHVYKGDKKYAFSYDEMLNLKPGLYTELIIPFLQSYLIGTSDRVIILENKEFIIEDYKCIDDLEIIPVPHYNVDKKKKEIKMFKILNHIPATKFNGYQIQLSMYSYFLEQFGYKFKSGCLEQVIFNENDEVIETIKHPIKYMKKEVETLIKFYKNKNM